jgi:UDP-N-acetylglucosamine 2-epimerase (non-hydrolysing)
MKHAALVVTDSGGIQEETTCLGIPCVTVRENTERPVTLNNGTNILAGVRVEGIREAIRRQQLAKKPSNLVPRMWDGKAGLRIVEILLREFYNTEISHRRAVPDYSKTLG